MDDATREENENFEVEVRRIARELWPSASSSGSVKVDGQERDGVFETEECLHLLEVTTSRRKDKAVNDIQKLVTLAKRLRRRDKAVKCWFITRDDPTSDQRAVADKHHSLVLAISFSQFQSKLIDVKAYLSARDRYPFGSVRDPDTGDLTPKIPYIPLGILNLASRATVSLDDILAALIKGQDCVLLGDYGAGKSMTLRYLYGELKRRNLRGETSTFPVYLNLRDHFGQTDPAEILERHAKAVGFPQSSHLVRAWRAGYVVLLLDGFDEVTTLGIQGLWKKLQDNRFRAMEPVRRFVRDHPKTAGLALAGRAHFFDSERERSKALELRPGTTELSLTEFTEDQIRQYLEKAGLTGSVPDWLPSRPLLIGYLAAKGLLERLTSTGGLTGPDPAVGWDRLLDAICDREAKIEAGIDGHTVRRILERLGTRARSSEGALGPLSGDDIISAFKEICGYSPDERGMILLQRLPGLGIDRVDEETRAFIDHDFADVCRGGDLVQFVENPYELVSTFQMVECSLMALGVSVATKKTEHASQRQINAALECAVRNGAQHLISDVCRILIERTLGIETQTYVRGILIPEIELVNHSGDASKLCFQDCFFGRVGIDPDLNANDLPRFERCYIGELDGRVSRNDLPAGVFDGACEIEAFTAAGDTTNEIMSLALPLGVRVLLTVLKKLYQRRGSGRRESALHRGLDHHSRRLVDSVLHVVETQGLAIRYRRGDAVVWSPERDATKRVGRIIASPNTTSDPVLKEVSTFD